MQIYSRAKLDGTGRIVIPKKIRDYLEINSTDELDVSFDGLTITITKRNISQLDDCIRQITEVADDNWDLTVEEYNKLIEILNKLKGTK